MAEDGREPGGWELLRAVTGIRDDIREMKTGFVTKEEFNNLKADVQELKDNGRFRLGTWLSVVGMVLSSGLALWAILKG